MRQEETGDRHVADPQLPILLQAASDERHDVRRNVGWQRRPLRRRRDDGGNRVGDGLAFERAAPREHLVEHRAERPHVGALVNGAAPRLLGRHVGGGAENDADAGHRTRRDRRRLVRIPFSRRTRIGELRESEVEHLHGPVLADVDVRRLQIPVHDALLVRRFERFGDLAGDRQGLVDGYRRARDAIGERLPFDELHHERLAGRQLFETVDGGDVRMIERRKHFGFALEAGEPRAIGVHRGGQHLDRNLTLQPCVERAIHLAHSAFAKLRDDFVGSDPCSGRQWHAWRSAGRIEYRTGLFRRHARRPGDTEHEKRRTHTNAIAVLELDRPGRSRRR